MKEQKASAMNENSHLLCKFDLGTGTLQVCSQSPLKQEWTLQWKHASTTNTDMEHRMSTSNFTSVAHAENKPYCSPKV